MENNNLNTTSNEPVVWPTNTDLAKKKKKLKIVYLVLAVLLTVGSALGSFYLSRNLNQASTPNAPASEPQAAAKRQKTLNTEANGCDQGCMSDEYCSAGGRCRKTGGNADGRTEWEQIAQAIPITTPTEAPERNAYGTEAIPGYTCTESNCGFGFHCKNSNTCVNDNDPNLSVANDIENCGGTGKKCTIVGQACIGGQCFIPSEYDCSSKTCDFAKGFKCLTASNGTEQCVLNSVTSVTPTAARPTVTIRPTISTDNDSDNCGGDGIRCAQGVQRCVGGVCVSQISSTTTACDGILPDQTIEVFNGQRINTAYTKTCCVPSGTGIGVIPTEALENTTNRPDPSIGQVVGSLDTRAHWTNCASGTTCRQGVGCIGAGGRIQDTELTSTTIDTPTGTITTTVTIPPTTTVTVPPTTTITTTVTIPPTITATPTGTVTMTISPTIAICNESCVKDEDCSTGLYCDSESNKCRKEECSSETSCVCPTETPEPTIVDCNYKCKTDDNCSSGLKCDSDSGRCRKPACSDEKDCSCPKPRKTDTPTREVTTRRTTTRTAEQPTVLKEAGILDLPGVAVFGSGLILTVIGILLAL